MLSRKTSAFFSCHPHSTVTLTVFAYPDGESVTERVSVNSTPSTVMRRGGEVARSAKFPDRAFSRADWAKLEA